MDSIQKYMSNKHKIIILGGSFIGKCFYISKRKRELQRRQMKAGDWRERMLHGNCVLHKMSRGWECGKLLSSGHFQETP